MEYVLQTYLDSKQDEEEEVYLMVKNAQEGIYGSSIRKYPGNALNTSRKQDKIMSM